MSIFVELAEIDRQLFREARKGLQQESRRFPKRLQEQFRGTWPASAMDNANDSGQPTPTPTEK